MKPSVALVQRSIPHYRLPLFEKLHNRSRFSWTYFCDEHPGGAVSGLAAPGYGELQVRQIRNVKLVGPFIFQSGVEVDLARYQVLMFDMGWTLVSNLWYLSKAKRRGVRCIGWTKGISQDQEKSKSRFRLAFERQIMQQYDALVVYGKASKEYCINLGYPEERIFVAQNAVDTSRIVKERALAEQQRDNLQVSLQLPDRPVVGYLGKIAAFKQVDKIVAAYEQARRMGLNALLLVAGKGPESEVVEMQMAASPFSNDILYVPDVPVGAELGYFQLFDLYLSFAQGGLGILEAMAHARPVLSTPEQFPETELLVDGDTAFLSSDFTVGAFARRMVEAMSNPAQREVIGKQAERCVVREATQEKMVEAIEDAVECVLSNCDTN